ncbi:hypothetical protein E6O75_ATG04972 [Venturia nashicola]|uniref:Uncharacterized protein n=1 Tax=Venturia nashicola TaxID=86259 RepID=A0A4Z1PHE4_9PEZI|nr:hypothetical protein E6O75_ATG04972 [Venturia nashicola]
MFPVTFSQQQLDCHRVFSGGNIPRHSGPSTKSLSFTMHTPLGDLLNQMEQQYRSNQLVVPRLRLQLVSLQEMPRRPVGGELLPECRTSFSEWEMFGPIKDMRGYERMEER